MQKTEFLQLLDELLELPANTLHGSEMLEDYGWSSIAAVGFMALADEHFGLEISSRRLARCVSVQDLIDIAGDQILCEIAA